MFRVEPESDPAACSGLAPRPPKAITIARSNVMDLILSAIRAPPTSVLRLSRQAAAVASGTPPSGSLDAMDVRTHRFRTASHDLVSDPIEGRVGPHRHAPSQELGGPPDAMTGRTAHLPRSQCRRCIRWRL